MSKVEERQYLIGEIAGILGVCRDALRKWERAGLIPKARRRPLGYRYYLESDLPKVRDAVAARLAEVRPDRKVPRVRSRPAA